MFNCFLNSKSSNYKYSFIEGLRGLSIILVFGVHFFGKYQNVNYYSNESSFFKSLFQFFHSGHIGVDCFFLISSFLIYKSIVNPKNKMTFDQFIYKRYSRLLPVIIFILIIPYVIYKTPEPRVIFDNIFFLNIFNSSSSIIIVTWSLVYEIYFYILAGLLFIVLPKKITTHYSFLLLICALIVIIHFCVTQQIIEEPIRFLGFFWGIFLAKYHLKISQLPILIKNQELITIIGFLLLSFMMFGWLNLDWVTHVSTNKLYNALFYIFIQLSFFLIIVSNLIGENRLKIILVNPYMQFLGMISYSFYIVHCFVIKINIGSKLLTFFNISNFASMLLGYLISLLLTVLLAYYSYNYLEKPYFEKK